MSHFCIVNFWDSLVTGFFASVLFAILIYTLQRLRYWYFIKRKFHNSTFQTFWKRYPNEVVYEVKCKVYGNKIEFSGNRPDGTNNFEGQFIINPINLRTGEGYHFHEKSDAFAFFKVVLKSDDIFLVDAPYTKVKENVQGNKVGSIEYQAFIWRRKSTTISPSLLNSTPPTAPLTER